MPPLPNSIRIFTERKRAGERLALVTAYDYPTAVLAERAGVDAILVGDSVANAVLGHSTTIPVTMEEMLHHTRAVARGVGSVLVISDMPFMSYQASEDDAVENAGRFLKEAGAGAVKMEGGERVTRLVRRLTSCGIPVMGHLGLTPQSVRQFGGFRVQGKNPEEARRMLDEARLLEEAGAFAVVLELVPTEVAEAITRALAIPTIGIGAGPGCDGEVQVLHDLIGLTGGFLPRHSHGYAEVGEVIESALRQYVADVRDRRFPTLENGTSVPELAEAVARKP